MIHTVSLSDLRMNNSAYKEPALSHISAAAENKLSAAAQNKK